MKRLMTILPLALVLAACSGVGAPAESPAPPTLDPVGVYDCSLDVDGMALLATLSIEGEPGAYTGMVDSEMGTMPVSNIAVEGNDMTFMVDTPEMAVYFAVTFEGPNFSGDFDAGGMGGFITGTKR
jgi:PBP1b-binding outer membrane lipoprotein LpoB